MGPEKPNAKLKIHLENDRLIMYGTPTESSGCVLRGALTLKLNHQTSIKSLKLRFYGTLAVSWSQRKLSPLSLSFFFTCLFTFFMF
jgi:hypothetical protein